MKQVLAMAVLGVLVAAPWVRAETPDPKALVGAVADALAQADSLKVRVNLFSAISVGEAAAMGDFGGAYEIHLQRPNLYRIEWMQSVEMVPLNFGTVWNAGDGPLVFMGPTSAWFPHESDALALGVVSRGSAGLTVTLPGAFFDMDGLPSLRSTLRSLAYAGEEEVDGTPCHKVTAKSDFSDALTLWIEQERPVLRKVQWELRPTSGDALTEEEIEEAIAELGDEASDELRESMRDMMAKMGSVVGHLGEEYVQFELNAELSAEDFAFTPPEGATEYASMRESVGDMGGAFAGGSEGGHNDKFAVGDTAPDFEGPTVEGETIKLSDYRGQVVLIDFWATWCGPCIAVLPGLIEAYDEYHEDGFEIIGVSLDFERDVLERFLDKREGMHWPNIYEEVEGSEIADEYGVQAIPFTLLLDREGVIRHRDLHGSALKEAIAELLAEEAR